MGILSILAVEEGQLKVQLHFSSQHLPKYCSAPVRPKAMLASLPQLLFDYNASAVSPTMHAAQIASE